MNKIIKIIWTAATRKNLRRKLRLEVLWRKSNIVKIEPIDPPKNVTTNRVFSGILILLFFAWNLSVAKMRKLIIVRNSK